MKKISQKTDFTFVFTRNQLVKHSNKHKSRFIFIFDDPYQFWYRIRCIVRIPRQIPTPTQKVQQENPHRFFQKTKVKKNLVNIMILLYRMH